MSDLHKAEQMCNLAQEHGWETYLDVDGLDELNPNPNDFIWTLYAKRGSETLKVCWRGNRQEEAKHTHPGGHRILWWKSEVVRFITSKPRFSEDDLPWDIDAPAIDIMRAVVNRTIVWIRSIDGAEMESLVDVDLRDPGSARHFRVYEAKNGRVIEWADKYGFHAVNLKQIKAVV